MSTDNHLQLVGGVAATDKRNGSRTASATAVPPDALTLRRRILAGRDINAKIDSLEREIVRLREPQEAARERLLQLQQRVVSVMADLMLASPPPEAPTHQRHTPAVLEGNGSLRELTLAGGLLDAQNGDRETGREQIDTPGRRQEALERQAERQGQCLQSLAAGTRQQFDRLSTQLGALTERHQEHEEALLALDTNQGLLALRVGQVETQLKTVGDTAQDQVRQARRRLRTLTAALVLLGGVTAGATAYLQWHGNAVPASLSQQLAGITLGLGTQSSRQAAMEGELAAQAGSLQDMQAQLRLGQEELARLQAQAGQALEQLQELRRELAEVRKARAVVVAPRQSQPAASAEHPERIVMPMAYPGSRPVY